MLKVNVSPYFMRTCRLLGEALTEPGLFGPEIEDVRKEFRQPFTDTDGLIETVQKANRLLMIVKSNLLGNLAFKEQLASLQLPAWKTMSTPVPFYIGEQGDLGRRLAKDAAKDKNAQAELIFGEGANHTIAGCIELLMARRVPMVFDLYDSVFERLVRNHTSIPDLEKYADFCNQWRGNITHRIIAAPGITTPNPLPQDHVKNTLFTKLTQPINQRASQGLVKSCLTIFPTETDAQVDGIPHKEYFKLFLDMADQPEKENTKACDVLVSMFNKAGRVRFTNKDGTDVTMSLVHEDGRHFTFANAQAGRNVPGSEIFSGVRLDSVNGIIVSKGKFLFGADPEKIIINLTRHFKDGVLVDYSAEQGAQHFEEFLKRDKGNYRIGELGVGTNAHLKHTVTNRLMVEKTGGSFHTAHGYPFKMDNYEGQSVFMDNDNTSIDHWDITTMLGDIYLDDERIMKDGLYLDPRLDVINRGWDAIPVEQRPMRWRNYAGPFIGAAPVPV